MSSLWDIALKVGGGIITDLVPGGRAIVSAVNAFMPDDKQLPSGATGSDVTSAISSLPADQRAEVMGKQFEVDITQIKEAHSTVRTMLEADAITPHTTRPKIALGAFRVVSFTIITAISIWAYGVTTGNEAMVKAVTEGWPFVIAVIAPLVTLLLAYFGILKQEQKTYYYMEQRCHT